jgi:hypothetical protein
MDKIISIVGSPQLTSWDMLLWRTELLVGGSGSGLEKWAVHDSTEAARLHLPDSVHAFVLTTPEHVASNTPDKEFEKFSPNRRKTAALMQTTVFGSRRLF